MIAFENAAQNAQGVANPLATSLASPQPAVPVAVGTALVLVDARDASELIGLDLAHAGDIDAPEPAWPLDDAAPMVEMPRLLNRVTPCPLPLEDAELVSSIEEIAARHEITEVVQFGCGRGSVLRSLVERGAFASACGVEVNAGLVEAAQRSVIDTRIHFACGDAVDWTMEFGRPCSAYVSLGGVLDRLTEAQLKLLFGQLGLRLRPAVIGFTESPVHPYARLLREAGFEIARAAETIVDGTRKVTIVAEVA